MAAKKVVAVCISEGMPFAVLEEEGKLYHHLYDALRGAPTVPVPDNLHVMDELQRFFDAKKQTPEACVCFETKKGFVFDPECQECSLHKYITNTPDSEDDFTSYKNEYDEFVHRYKQQKEELKRIESALGFLEKLRATGDDAEALETAKMLLQNQKIDTYEALYGIL